MGQFKHPNPFMLCMCVSVECWKIHRQPELELYFSGNQPRGGRGTPTNSSTVTPVAIVTAKEEHSNQPVVANLAALPAPATNAVLPDSQPLTTASELPVSWSFKFKAVLVLQCAMLKLSIVLLFSLDTLSLAFHVPNNVCGQFHMRFYTKHLYIGFFNVLLTGKCGEASCHEVEASSNIFQGIITQKFCNLVGHLEGGYNRILVVTSMFALTVKGEKLLPSSPPSGPLSVIVVLQFSVYRLIKFS